MEFEVYNETVQRCRQSKKVTNCDWRFSFNAIQSKILKTKAIRDRVEELVSALQHPDSDTLPKSIRKRAVPLGFVGSLRSYLFGTLTTEDADKIDSEINKLYNNQNNLTRIMAEQTHIVTGELHTLHQIAENHQIEIIAAQNKINEMINKTTILKRTLNYRKD